MLIDVHVHYGFLFFPIKSLQAKDIVATMDRHHIDISIISNINGLFYDFRDCNKALSGVLQHAPQRLKGYIVCNPNYIDHSIRELEKFRSAAGFVGVKLHPSWHHRPIDGKEFAPILEKCEELHLPILIHSYVVEDFGDQPSCPERIANAAKRHKNQFVVAHMGGNHKRCIKAVRHLEHVSVDISTGRERAAQAYVWRYGRVDEAVCELGASRVLFGSDFPLVDVSIARGMMADSRVTEEQREMIEFKNAQRIFGL